MVYACLASATEDAERSRWTTMERLKPHAGWRACSAAISDASCTWPWVRVRVGISIVVQVRAGVGLGLGLGRVRIRVSCDLGDELH